jgi:transcriptional regulator with XRE-family HTH domain
MSRIRRFRNPEGARPADLPIQRPAVFKLAAEAHVSMLESGKRKAPSLPALQRLAKALGAPVAELLG